MRDEAGGIARWSKSVRRWDKIDAGTPMEHPRWSLLGFTPPARERRQPSTEMEGSANDPAPEFILRNGYPTDLLTWFRALPAVCFLGGMAAGFVAFMVFVLTMLIWPGPGGLGPWILALFSFAFVFRLWLIHHFEVSREQFSFYIDRVVAEIRDPARRGSYLRVEIPYNRVRSVILTHGPATIQVHFRPPETGPVSSFDARAPELSARDHLDQCVELIEAHDPDHLFAIELDGEVRYSKDWDPDEVQPCRAEIRGDGSIDEIEGNIVTHAQLAGHRFEVAFRGFQSSAIRRVDADDQLPILAGRYTTAGTSVRIFDRTGMLVAWFPMRVAQNEIKMQFGWGPILRFNLTTANLELDGEPIGTLRRDGNGARFVLTAAVHELVGLAIFMITGFFSETFRLQEPHSTSSMSKS